MQKKKKNKKKLKHTETQNARKNVKTIIVAAYKTIIKKLEETGSTVTNSKHSCCSRCKVKLGNRFSKTLIYRRKTIYNQ